MLVSVRPALRRASPTSAISAMSQNQRRGFASEKELKKRMNAVRSIIKITKSSKMIAAAKFRGASMAVEPARGMARPILEFWQRVLKRESLDLKEDEDVFTEGGTTTIIPITADRGLCGSFNSVIIRRVRKIVANRTDVSVVLVGDRAKSGLSRPLASINKGAVTGVSKIIPIAYPISFVAAKLVTSSPTDSYVYMWNYYKNAMSYATKNTRIPSFAKITQDMSGVNAYEIEGDMPVLQDLYEFTHAVLVHHFLADCGAGEQSQRMAAMEGSTKNASELMEALKLQYNRTRQSKITTELVEVVSGAISMDEVKK